MVERHPRDVRFLQHLAECCLAVGRCEQARALLERAMQRERSGSTLQVNVIRYANAAAATLSHMSCAPCEPSQSPAHLRIGSGCLRARRIEEAEGAFRKALEADRSSAGARLGMARVRLAQQRHEEAAQEAIEAIRLRYFLPAGHFYLGLALARLGRLREAAAAFETCASMRPGLLNAHRWLASIYTRIGEREKAAEHSLRAAEIRRKRSPA
jgi:tetratricopeptide (TPR) repeat protein